jgi:putative ABC transport system ATP-binding protein
MLEVNNISKVFNMKGRQLTVLDNLSFEADDGETMAIVGPSGSGKTTLLGICAGLDLPSTGYVSLAGVRLNALDEDDRAHVRNRYVGFIFQSFQLLPTLNALENVMVPIELRGDTSSRSTAEKLLARVGLADRMDHYPAQLSGGEQQRVAIARAFITEPSILFADEPTGNLDEETAEHITELIFDLNKEQNTTLVLVTHNLQLAERTDRILLLKSGKLVEDKKLNVV